MAVDPCPAVRGHMPVVVVGAAVVDGDAHEDEDNYMVEVASSQEARSCHMEQS